MTTASPAPPDLKAVAASYNDGLRWLVLCVVTDPSLQAESSVTQFRQKMASLNDQVEEVRCRSAEIQKAKEEFERLLKELKKRNAEVKTAKSNLEALSQKVGEAAFREFLAGRLTEFPALQTRRDIQQQIDALSKEKVQVDQAAQTGFADKVKTVAHSTTLSGRILLQKQKVASADRSLGSAVLETQQDEQVLATDAIDVLSKVREARKAIADGEENHTLTKRQMDDCRSHAVTLGVVETDSSHFDGEYKKCVERLLDLECKKLSARWEFGQSLLSSPPEALPEHLRQLTVEMSRIASEHPEACNQPPTVIADLKEQVSLLHEKVGTVIFEKGLFKDTLSEEFSKVTAATKQDRGSELRQLGKAACDKHSEKMVSDESTQTIFSELKAIELTIKELSGKTLVGTDGKAAPTHITLGGIGCLAVTVIIMCALIAPAVQQARQAGRRAQQKQVGQSSNPQQPSTPTESVSDRQNPLTTDVVSTQDWHDPSAHPYFPLKFDTTVQFHRDPKEMYSGKLPPRRYGSDGSFQMMGNTFKEWFFRTKDGQLEMTWAVNNSPGEWVVIIPHECSNGRSWTKRSGVERVTCFCVEDGVWANAPESLAKYRNNSLVTIRVKKFGVFPVANEPERLFSDEEFSFVKNVGLVKYSFRNIVNDIVAYSDNISDITYHGMAIPF